MSKKFDPVLIEVMRHELISVSEEMNITMKQTTRSIVAKEGGDFSAGIIDPEGNVIAQAVPYGLGYFTAVMPHIIKKWRGHLNPNDMIVSNDPYGGLSHLPDIAVVKPIFWRDEHCGFSAVVEHHTDIGGRFPGGMGLLCEEIYEEGLRLPAVRLYVDGKLNEAVREIIAANVRAPDDVLGDPRNSWRQRDRRLHGVRPSGQKRAQHSTRHDRQLHLQPGFPCAPRRL